MKFYLFVEPSKSHSAAAFVPHISPLVTK